MGANERGRGASISAFVVCTFVLTAATSAQSLLQRPVEVHASRVTLSQALSLIARDGGFKLSYNAAAIRGDSIVDVALQGSAGEAMSSLLGDAVILKESGEHVILLARGGTRNMVTVHGAVIDAATRQPLARASVYAVDESDAVASNADGRFTLRVEGGEAIAIRIARAMYHDTIVFAAPDGALGTVALHARSKMEPMEPICRYERCEVEDLGVARLLVPNTQMDQAANLDLAERRSIQASLWPSVGTNKEISGAVVNEMSFNLIAGYARGLEGFELGVGVNMERNYVKGMQVGGLANLVGGDTKGVQVAGALNHTMRSLEGVQIAGFGNTVWDTLSGAQVAGGANVVKGGMRGFQIAGGCNVTTVDLNGVQVAGGINVTVRNVEKTQVAGGINYGRNVQGAQVVGGINVALGAVGGGQVAGGINYARVVSGGQVAAGINVAVDTVRGGQVGVLNFGRVVKGGQVGILNFSDTITGSSVGILSFAWRGYHRFDVQTNDVMPLSLVIRTGTRGFHNLFGYSPGVTSDGRWGFLYGFGTEPRIGKRGFLNIDLTGEQIVEQPEWVDAVNILGRLSVSAGFDVNQYVNISAGPVANLLISDWRDPDTGAYVSALPPAIPSEQWISGDAQLSAWWGWRASIGLRF